MIELSVLLDRIDALPPLPATSVRLINVIGDPSASVTDIVEVIKYDQALTSEVLRLCNSAYFGLSRQIASLNDAMVCLGTLKLLQLVMSVHANAMLTLPQEGYGLEAGMLWRQSVATALAAADFAKRVRYQNVNLAFTAGLLHDIGKIVLSRHVAEEFTAILAQVNEKKCTFVEAEREVLGFDHTQVGGLVAERWKLPEAIVRCIKYQYEPQRLNPPDALVDVVYLGNCVCLMMGIALGTDGLTYRADDAVAARYKLAEPDLEAVGMSMFSELERIAYFRDETPAAQEASL
ncbi:MAG TPA: HDOD domain-containing protein [Phycisphaerae bacterium]|nr:HDOD domain-containing protein [Phycisphaerae bacterium]